MPPALRGSIHRYDFGPSVGHELSGCRPALILSNTELNCNLTLAIAMPTSRTPPGKANTITTHPLKTPVPGHQSGRSSPSNRKEVEPTDQTTTDGGAGYAKHNNPNRRRRPEGLPNPYADTHDHNFSYGFILRQAAGKPYLLYMVHSNGVFQVHNRTAPGPTFPGLVAGGQASNLRVGANQWNYIAALASGDTGSIFLNGEWLRAGATGLDIISLGAGTESGGIDIMTGYNPDEERAGPSPTSRDSRA